MIIKASRITNLTDARYFAAKDVAFLGFNLEEGTPGYLDPMYMKAIREWVEGPEIVAEYSCADVAYLKEAVSFYGLSILQLEAESHLDILSELQGVDILLHLDGQSGAERCAHLMAAAAPNVRYFILDFSGMDPLTDVEAWKTLVQQYPVLLHLDAEATLVAKIMETLQPAGLSLSGGEEEAVGVKSFEDIDAVLDMLEE